MRARRERQEDELMHDDKPKHDLEILTGALREAAKVYQDDAEHTYERTPVEKEIARQVREQMETNSHEVAELRYELGRAIDQRDTLATENARLRDVIEEVRDMLQDFTHTDDHTARHAARALLDAVLHPELYAPDAEVNAPIVLSAAQACGDYPLPQIVQRDDATKELRDVLAYFVCNFPAGTEKGQLFDDMFSRGMELIGIAPDGSVSAPTGAWQCVEERQHRLMRPNAAAGPAQIG